MMIQFTEPDLKHPDSDISIYMLAKELESRYHLCERFITDKKIIESLESRVLNIAMRNYSKERIKFDIENFTMNLWRDYIVKELHGIITKEAKNEGRKSFIKSGAYYKSMRISVVL